MAEIATTMERTAAARTAARVWRNEHNDLLPIDPLQEQRPSRLPFPGHLSHKCDGRVK